MIIDLNCDLGESDIDTIEENDALILPYISSVNIASGGHAGNVDTMRRVTHLAIKNSVFIGAHPSYPDKANFGRQSMQIPYVDLQNSLIDQIGTLQLIVNEVGGKLRHIKPHGALYNDAANNNELAAMLIETILTVDESLTLVVPARSKIAQMAEQYPIKTLIEVFADRAYSANGQLVSRSLSNALITDLNHVVKRAKQMVIKKHIICIDGTMLQVSPDTICIHGDHPNAVNIVRAMADAFTKSGIKIIKHE